MLFSSSLVTPHSDDFSHGKPGEGLFVVSLLFLSHDHCSQEWYVLGVAVPPFLYFYTIHPIIQVSWSCQINKKFQQPSQIFMESIKEGTLGKRVQL